MLMSVLLGLIADFLQLSTVPYLLESIVGTLIFLFGVAAAFQIHGRIKKYFDNQFSQIGAKSVTPKSVYPEPRRSIEYDVAKRSLIDKLKNEGVLARKGKEVNCDLKDIAFRVNSQQQLGMFLVAAVSHGQEITKIAYVDKSASHFLCTNFKDMLTKDNPNLSLVKMSTANTESYLLEGATFAQDDDIVAVIDQAGDGTSALRIVDSIAANGGYIHRVIALYDDELGAGERLRKNRVRLTSLLTKTEVEKFYE
jgi:hypothetical protein